MHSYIQIKLSKYYFQYKVKTKMQLGNYKISPNVNSFLIDMVKISTQQLQEIHISILQIASKQLLNHKYPPKLRDYVRIGVEGRDPTVKSLYWEKTQIWNKSYLVLYIHYLQYFIYLCNFIVFRFQSRRFLFKSIFAIYYKVCSSDQMKILQKDTVIGN